MVFDRGYLQKLFQLPTTTYSIRTNLTQSYIYDISIITGYLGEKIKSHIENIDDLPRNINIDFFQETQPLGNIGSLGQIEAVGKPILFSFGDLVTDMNFSKLIEIHSTRDADITLSSHYETHKVRLGELTVTGDTVTGYAEKPLKKFLICSGIGIFNPETLQLIPENIPSGISDLISNSILSGYTVSHWLHNTFWMDINSLEALEEANQILLGKKV